MAAGESTTAEPSGYRTKFYELAVADGLNVDMVGPNSNGTGYDAYNAGFIGFTCSELLNQFLLFYSNYSPDIVLLLEGTNDCGWHYQSNLNIPSIDELSPLIDTICNKYPNTLVFVSTIPPMSDNAYTDQGVTPFGVARTNAVAYNDAMPGMIATKIAAGEKVYFIDTRGVLNDADILGDGIHPNQSGYNKMGVLYYSIIKPYIKETALLYPNPVTDYKLTIYLKTDEPQDVSLTLYSMKGAKVFIQNDIKYTAPVEVVLPQSLSAGLYILTIKYGGVIIRKKIIIQ